MNMLYVIEPDFTLAAAIAGYTNFQMKRKLYEIGEIELHAPFDAFGAEELKPGRIVYITPDKPAILTKVEISESKKGAEIAAYGMQLKGIVARRVTVPDTEDEQMLFGYDRFPRPEEPEDSAESIFKHYARKHMVEPLDARRKIPNLSIELDQNRGKAGRWSSRFEGLDALYKALGEYAEMGYDIALDLENKRMVFDVIPGVDHTASSNFPVIFSTAYHNMATTKYSADTKPIVNAAYAGGAGENEARLIQTIFRENATGLERRESWLDCGNIELVEELVYEANHKLEKSILTETLTGTITPTGPFVYGEDYDLGDIVTVQSKVTGLEKDAQITEISESYEKGERKVSVTFGKRQQNILDEIRKMEAVR